MDNEEIRTATVAMLRGLADALEKDPNALVTSLQQTRGTKVGPFPDEPGRLQALPTGDFTLALTLSNFGLRGKNTR